MRGLVSYRVVAVGYLVAWVVMDQLVLRSKGVVGEPVCFDPRYMWETIPMWRIVVSLLSIATTYFVVGLSIGLNRAAPRWCALICLMALFPDVERYLSLRWPCMGGLERSAYWTWVTAHALMCLQHAMRWGARPCR